MKGGVGGNGSGTRIVLIFSGGPGGSFFALFWLFFLLRFLYPFLVVLGAFLGCLLAPFGLSQVAPSWVQDGSWDAFVDKK